MQNNFQILKGITIADYLVTRITRESHIINGQIVPESNKEKTTRERNRSQKIQDKKFYEFYEFLKKNNINVSNSKSLDDGKKNSQPDYSINIININKETFFVELVDCMATENQTKNRELLAKIPALGLVKSHEDKNSDFLIKNISQSINKKWQKHQNNKNVILLINCFPELIPREIFSCGDIRLCGKSHIKFFPKHILENWKFNNNNFKSVFINMKLFFLLKNTANNSTPFCLDVYFDLLAL